MFANAQELLDWPLEALVQTVQSGDNNGSHAQRIEAFGTGHYGWAIITAFHGLDPYPQQIVVATFESDICAVREAIAAGGAYIAVGNQVLFNTQGLMGWSSDMNKVGWADFCYGAACDLGIGKTTA